MAAKDPPMDGIRQPLAIALLVNCVLAGLCTLYVSTDSELVTLAAAFAVSMIVLVALASNTSAAHRSPVVAEKGGGVAEPYDEFFVSWFPRLVAILAGYGYERTVAEDAAEEALIELCTRWESVKHPQAWSLKVASVKAGEVARRARHGMSDGPGWTHDWSDGVDTLVVVERALDELRSHPKQREVLLLTLAGLKPKEIAEQIGVDPGQVRANLKNARKLVKDRLQAGREG